MRIHAFVSYSKWFGIVPVAIFIWLLKNFFTPIGDIEQIASIFSSSNPWMWVLGLFGLLISTLVIKTIWEGVKEWIREHI
jgi:divalent metal cation (Fe/Co/Zn/Cd) transporter